MKAKDESRAKMETENSSTDEIDDIDDERGMNKLSGLNGVQNSNENNENSLNKNTCQSNGVQESNGDTIASDASETSKENGEGSHTNGFENTEKSPQIHPDNNTVNAKKDCVDEVDLEISAS